MKNNCYPRMIICFDGATRTVTDHIQHSNLTGKTFGPDAQEIVAVEPPQEEPVEHEPGEMASSLSVEPEPEAAPVKNKGGRPKKVAE